MTQFAYRRVPLVETHRNIGMHVGPKGQCQNKTSGQGHVVSQVGHVAYQSMRLCGGNTLEPPLAPFTIISKVRGKKTNLISYDFG